MWVLAWLACAPSLDDAGAGRPELGPVADEASLAWQGLGQVTAPRLPATCDGERRALVGDSGFLRVQDAIEAAIAGEVVVLCPGVHEERLRIERDLTLRGEGARGEVVLDGGGLRRPITAEGGVRLELAGLTVRNGDASSGGGVLVDGSVVLRDMLLIDNHADSHGGAVWASGLVRIEDSLLEANGAWEGGAVYGGRVELVRTALDHNAARHHGGAVRSEGLLHVEESRFTGNLAAFSGGAVAVDGEESESWVQASTFTDNRAGSEGGAIAWLALERGWLTVEDVVFERSSSDYEGGALFVESEGEVSLSVRDSRIADSLCTRTGAGVKLDGAGTFDVLFERTELLANTAEQGSALAVSHRVEAATVVLSDARLAYHQGAAVRIPVGTSLASLWTDWSSEEADNDPVDIMTERETVRWGGRTYGWCDADGSCSRW